MAITILDSLKSINRYPVPETFYTSVFAARGIDGDGEAKAENLNSAAYNLAKADVLIWLSNAPDISQGGQTYGFTDEQRTLMRNEAYSLYREYGEGVNTPKPTYGYKGSRL
jgi:hypothetical protein